MDKKYLKLDWLQFSFRLDLDPFKIDDQVNASLLQQKKFWEAFPELAVFKDRLVMRSKPIVWYNATAIVDDDYLISWTNEYISCSGTNLGINVSVPSHGLERFFSLFGLTTSPEDVSKMFSILNERSCTPTRLDFAFDDLEKKYTPHDYASLYTQDRIVTRFRNVRFFASSAKQGATFYVGSRQNGKMLRIYDKNYESKGEINSIRYEVEVHKIYAKQIFDVIIEHPEIDFLDLLISFFFVAKENGYSHESRSRADMDLEWLDYLKSQFNAKMPVKVTLTDPRKRNADVMKWLTTTCQSAIGSAYLVYGDYIFRSISRQAYDKHKINKDFLNMYKDELYTLGFYDLLEITSDMTEIDSIVSATSIFD